MLCRGESGVGGDHRGGNADGIEEDEEGKSAGIDLCIEMIIAAGEVSQLDEEAAEFMFERGLLSLRQRCGVGFRFR